MSFEGGIDDRVFRVSRADKAIEIIVRPVHAESKRERNEPVVEWIGGMVVYKSVS